MTRRRLVPEVIQTSAMDCGPACLAALLAGHGAAVSYERLREACQTDVDGTSIDTIEQAAVALGLAAEQILVPVDHVLLAEAEALPALAVTRQPDGGNHFIVLWSQLGGRVQVMDPAVAAAGSPRGGSPPTSTSTRWSSPPRPGASGPAPTTCAARSRAAWLRSASPTPRR